VKDAFIVTLLSVLPRKSGARLVGRIARTTWSKWLTRWFVAAYKVDLSEASRPLSDYQSLEDLFTRELKPGSRPIDSASDRIVSPVDGRVAYIGSTVDGRIVLDGGQTLDTNELLGEELPSERDVAILYLSPTEYHRVHVPREGVATAWRYLPGDLWVVFPAAVRRVKGLFQGNERAVVRFDTDKGPLDVVLVGAFGVGRISLAVCDLLTNTSGKPCEGRLQPPRQMERGAPLGIFHLGSTVILCSPKGSWSWTVAQGAAVRVGEPIGRSLV
jgi:phosphatidylserine decarboxylase